MTPSLANWGDGENLDRDAGGGGHAQRQPSHRAALGGAAALARAPRGARHRVGRARLRPADRAARAPQPRFGRALARRSLELADRLVVLQDEARRALPARLRSKARVVYQSADTALRAAPPRGRFRVLVSGHLREEKDPFRAAAALEQLRALPHIEILQLGAALSDDMRAQAEAWARREPRYRWLGARSHPRALGWIARSQLLVLSSAMEGGANVIAEAARIGTPVLASRIAGNLGMLGRAYPGYFPFGDERALATLIARAAREPADYARLKRALRARRRLFAPAAERRALAALLGELL
jgi:glycosyltransferase involved in cell wall biosynthesis